MARCSDFFLSRYPSSSEFLSCFDLVCFAGGIIVWGFTQRPFTPIQGFSSFIHVRLVLRLQRQGRPSGQRVANSLPIQSYRIIPLFLSHSRKPRDSALGLAIDSACESCSCHFFPTQTLHADLDLDSRSAGNKNRSGWHSSIKQVSNPYHSN